MENDFNRWLDQIKNFYRQEDRRPGCLREIGYVPRWTVVIAEGEQWGIAFNFTGGHGHPGIDSPDELGDIRYLIGRDLFYCAEKLLDAETLPQRSLASAVLNALSRPFSTRAALEERGMTEEPPNLLPPLFPDDKVVVIGYGGLPQRLREHVKVVHVSEMRPAKSFYTWRIGTAVTRGPQQIVFHSAEENAELLSDADVVFMTGCTLVNGTFSSLMEQSKHARFHGVYGPSAGLLPECLWNEGVDWISTYRIEEENALLDRLTGDGSSDLFVNGLRNHVILNPESSSAKP